MTTTNSVVANAIKAQAVRNSVEVEISPGYAARVQHAMRDAARAVSGVRMTSTNTLECRDEDAADDVIDILKQAGLPDGEVWTNARRAAANAIGDLDFDMKGVYETAKKMLAAGATHKGGYHWSVPKTYATGAGVVASRVGGAVKVVRDDPDRAGFVIAEITDPLAQALERKGVPSACRTAKNANEWIDDPKKRKALAEIGKKADALYRQLKDIARKFDALKNEQAKVVGFYFADYSDAARQIREIHGME